MVFWLKRSKIKINKENDRLQGGKDVKVLTHGKELVCSSHLFRL